METLDTPTGGGPAPEAPAPDSTPGASEQQPAARSKKKGGGNRSREERRRLARKIRELEARLVDNPLLEEARAPETTPEAPAPGAPVAPAGDPSAPASTVHRLGEEQAAVLFAMICNAYDTFAPDLALRFVVGRLERMAQGDARAVFGQVQQLARLGDDDKAMLGPPIIKRLAELEVDDDFDLWAALLFVFGGKFMAIMAVTDPEKGAAMARIMAAATAPKPPPDVVVPAAETVQ